MIRAGILFLFILALPTGSLAEHRCVVEVKYRWQKDSGGDVLSFWARVEKRAEGADAARETAKKFADIEQGRAFEACVRQHQNLSGCISSKMAAYQEVMQNLAFSARAKLEESIVTDCKSAQGSCQGVEVSEPVCVDLSPPPPPGEGEEEEPDKKKKKKKKK